MILAPCQISCRTKVIHLQDREQRLKMLMAIKNRFMFFYVMLMRNLNDTDTYLHKVESI